MSNNITIFETGATSAAVNELILYTDNTRELAELRDAMYTDCLSNTTTEYIDFVGLCSAARSRYKKEMGSFFPMSLEQRKEYCQIYANRFPEWKRERERQQRNMEYKVVSECNNLEVWARGFYGDSGKEKAQRMIDEGYWHKLMYESDKHKKLIVIQANSK